MAQVWESVLKRWVMEHAAAGQKKLYFTINGDIPLMNPDGRSLLIEIPVRGKRVCVLHPLHLTPVALICYDAGVQMVQVAV